MFRVRLAGFGLALATLASTIVSPASAADPQPWPRDWREYYYNAGADAHFYYSPGSVTRHDSAALVYWTDSRPKGAEKLIYVVLITCDHRTIQTRRVHRFRTSDSSWIGEVELYQQAPEETVTPGSMADRLLQAVC